MSSQKKRNENFFDWRIQEMFMEKSLVSASPIADNLRYFAVSPADDPAWEHVWQDRTRDRLNIALEIGMENAMGELRRLLDEAASLEPDCVGRSGFRDWLRGVGALILSGAGQRFEFPYGSRPLEDREVRR